MTSPGRLRQRHDPPAIRSVDPIPALRGGPGRRRRLRGDASARRRAALRQWTARLAFTAVTGISSFITGTLLRHSVKWHPLLGKCRAWGYVEVFR